MHRIRCFFLFLLLGMLGTPLAAATPSSTTPTLPQGTTTDWWGAVQHDLQAREYHVSATAAGLQAPNRRHNFRTYFEPKGIRVVEREEREHKDLLRLRLDEIGRSDVLRPVKAGVVTSQGNRVEITRPGLVEWYENHPEGLEQGFTLAQRPRGSGELILRLAVEGATVQRAGEEVEFLTSSGRRLRYGKLVTRDAKGREVKGRIAVKTNGIHLVIADAGARYPLTIDPLLTGTADAQLESDQASALLGASVAGAGDVNGDGFDDVIVGAPFFDSGQSNEGAAFVYHGRAIGINTNADVRLESNQADAQLGASVAGAGDVNDDGDSDVIVGAPFFDSGQSNEGAAFVYHGSAGGVSANADVRLESDQADAQLGASVAGAGDVNDDGDSDVIVGAPFFDSGQSNEGAAFVYHGSAGGVSANADVRLESDQADAQLGASVAGAGDVNDDGDSDVIVGAPFFDSGQSNEGAAFVYHGSAGGVSENADVRLEGNQTGAELGSSVAGVGDVNGDGFSDVIVGAPLFNNGQTDEGMAFVYHGSVNGVDTNADVRLEGNQSDAELGAGVAGAGDVNGDGFSDVIIGAPLFNSGQSDEGVAFVYHGSSDGVDTNADARLEGNQTGAELGVSVAGAGDVNGDGFSDVIVGAPLFNSGQSDEGVAFVYHGSATVSLSINNVTLAEGSSGTTAFMFTVSLATPSATTVMVNYATTNGTATAGNDYTAGNGTLTFTPGQTSKTVTVNVTGDTSVEPTETFFVNLSNATGGATIADGRGVGTIQNDDVIALAINNVRLREGNSGTTAFTFTVSLLPASTGTVTVRYATANDSALAGSDYTATSGTLIFTAGQTSKLVTVNVIGNTTEEPNETFAVNLSSPSGAVLGDGQGVGAILNDDGPTLRITNVSKAEGNSGVTAFTFTVSLLPASTSTVTVRYATANGSALAGSDYTETGGTLIFTAGQTSKLVTVNVIGNTTVEPNETFVVNLGPVSGAATILDGQGIGIILNDEGPVLRINDVSKTEGNSGVTAFTFTVTLPPASRGPVTVNYATANGSALAGSDYTATSGTLTFTAGQTSKTVTVNVISNTTVEPNETFAVNLSSAVGATIFDGQGVGTILNDDPMLRINDVSRGEGNSGVTPFTFTVSLAPASTRTVTVRYTTANGSSALAGGDYTATNGILTFSPLQTSKTVTINVIGNTTVEPNETFAVNLSSAVGATIFDSQGVGTILNDDGPVLRINDVGRAEGNSGVTAFTFTVTLSPASTSPVTVRYAMANGNALAGSDYVALPLTTLTFLPGQTSKLVTVNVLGNTLVEPNETFTVNLSGAAGATIFDSQGVGTIVNDDGPTLRITNVSKAEGNSGTTAFPFTVSLVPASTGTVTVRYATANGSALAGSDYTATSGALTFTAGQPSKTVTVNVLGNTMVEPNEAFVVNLGSAVGATIFDGQGVGTIVNDE